MFRAFNLSALTFPPPNSYFSTGLKLFQDSTTAVRKGLEAFLIGGKLDGTKMGTHWFPAIHANVFISHSHKDEEMAINTAGYLSEKFGLTAFIDSCVWGNSADLLRQIDDKYCLFSDKKSYDYSRRNESTSHVHMMLATALAKMIDRTECVFFLNTPNSITAEEAVERTFSPWIFNELAMISLIRRRTPEAHRPTKKEASFAAKERMDESLLIQYEADFSALDQISHITLNKWDRIYEGWGEALDFLYKLVPQQSVI